MCISPVVSAFCGVRSVVITLSQSLRRIDHIERSDGDGSSHSLAIRSMVRIDADDSDGNVNADAARVLTLRDTIRSFDHDTAAALCREENGLDEGITSSNKSKKLHVSMVESLEEDTLETHWLVVKRRVKVMPGIERGGATETVLGIAFEAISHRNENSSNDANAMTATTAELPVFAFLPIAPAGFRFVLHADWILASSRETVLHDIHCPIESFTY